MWSHGRPPAGQSRYVMADPSSSTRAHSAPIAVAAAITVLSVSVALVAFAGRLDWRFRLAIILAIVLATALVGLLLVRRHRLSALLLRTETSLRQMQEVTNDIRMAAATGEETIRDPGTLLHSRPFMEEVLAREMSRASRAHDPVTLMLFHLEGLERAEPRAADRMLRAVGLTLQKRARSFDTICRFDRQVIGVLLPGLSEQEAGRRCYELVTAAEESRAQHRSGPAEAVAVTVGVAVHGRRDAPEDGQSLIRRAQVSLYQSRTGSPQLEPAPQAPASPGADSGPGIAGLGSPILP